jgi:hypothetical protein
MITTNLVRAGRSFPKKRSTIAAIARRGRTDHLWAGS